MARKLGELLLTHRVFELTEDGQWRVAAPVAGAPLPVLTPQRELLLARLNASPWTPDSKHKDEWDGARKVKSESEEDALLPVDVE
jgi:hypothetical protein